MENETPETNKPKVVKNPKNNKKTISSIIFLVCLTALVVTLFFSLGEINDIIQHLTYISEGNRWVWIVVAVLLTLGYFALWPLSLCFFAKSNKADCSFKDSYLIGCSEHFYNGITPFAAGGQPFQVYSYTKKGVSAGKATGIVLANFAVFLLVTNVIALIALAFWPQFTEHLGDIQTSGGTNMDANWFIWIAITGYIINFLVLVFMVALGTSHKLRNGIVGLARWFCKFKWIGKHFSSKIIILEEYCDNAQIAFKQIVENKKAFVYAFISRFLAMICYYAVPYFVMKAVGVELTAVQFFLVFFGTSFAITATVFVPTPGGTGGIEYAFAIVLASVAMGQLGMTQAVCLVWRLITFYLVLIISFIAGTIYEAQTNKELKRRELDESKEI